MATFGSSLQVCSVVAVLIPRLAITRFACQVPQYEHRSSSLQTRVQPEQITINIGKDADVPEPPEGHSWGKVQHDNTVSWLAMWKENINGNTKYVFLAAGSSLKGQSDMKKFEKARALKVRYWSAYWI